VAFTDIYDITQPPDTQLANLLGQDIRNFKLDVQQRMAAISGISSAMPSFAADAQSANWTGMLFFATDNGHIYQFNGTIWVDVTTLFFDQITYKNANAVTGISIPGNTLAVGSVIEAAFQIIQPPGTGACSMLVGGILQQIFGANGGASTFNWYVFIKILVIAIGITGHVGGQFSAAAFNGSSFALPLEDFTSNTTNPFAISAATTAGCTFGNIVATVTL
jgi:hypothetical protein